MQLFYIQVQRACVIPTKLGWIAEWRECEEGRPMERFKYLPACELALFIPLSVCLKKSPSQIDKPIVDFTASREWKRGRSVRRSSEALRSSDKWQIRRDVEGGRDKTGCFSGQIALLRHPRGSFSVPLVNATGTRTRGKKRPSTGGGRRKRC